MIRKFVVFALAGATLAISVIAPTAPAQAYWRGGYGYGYRGVGPGAIVGGALLGLGVGALLAAPYVAHHRLCMRPRRRPTTRQPMRMRRIGTLRRPRRPITLRIKHYG